MREKILMYKIEEYEKQIVTNFFRDKYEVIDEDSCFTDILAVPAVVIFMNPEELEEDEITHLNDVFQWDKDTMIVFTGKPQDPEHILFDYYEEDLARLRDRTYEPMDDDFTVDLSKGTKEVPMELEIDPEWENEMLSQYDDAVRRKEQIVREIDQYILPDHYQPYDQVLLVWQREAYFRRAYELLHYREKLRSRERVGYREELMDIMLAVKIAYGFTDESENLSGRSAGNRTDWILKLAEMLKNHREEQPLDQRFEYMEYMES